MILIIRKVSCDLNIQLSGIGIEHSKITHIVMPLPVNQSLSLGISDFTSMEDVD
jgi:hypothetical protein